MYLFDCTLRDGANVVGLGFSADLTKLIIEGLIDNNIKVIEMGHAHGFGTDAKSQALSAMSDTEYLNLIQPYLKDAEIGMFMGVANSSAKNIEACAEKGLKFLRIGANAGDGYTAKEGIAKVKQMKMKAYYSLMKGYILSADELAEEAVKLESYGLDAITIMDSAGTMTPDDVSEYVTKMTARIKIPVGFHGHNNLGLSVANALAAEKSGAGILDCGLMGMARSAGNLATEMAVATLQRQGKLQEVDFYGLLSFIDEKLAPAMAKYNYKSAVSPMDLILGYSGCHSNFINRFKKVAEEMEVPVLQLIVKVSEVDKKAPSEELIVRVARNMKS